MTLKTGDTVEVFLVRVNGALEAIFTSQQQAEAFMRTTRKNGQFWRIQPQRTVPHGT